MLKTFIFLMLLLLYWTFTSSPSKFDCWYRPMKQVSLCLGVTNPLVRPSPKMRTKIFCFHCCNIVYLLLPYSFSKLLLGWAHKKYCVNRLLILAYICCNWKMVYVTSKENFKAGKLGSYPFMTKVRQNCLDLSLPRNGDFLLVFLEVCILSCPF